MEIIIKYNYLNYDHSDFNNIYINDSIFIDDDELEKPKDPKKEMAEIIKKTIKNKCDFFKNIQSKDPLFIEFLLDRFAVNFILWHDLEKNNKNLSMWLHYNQNLDER